MPRFWTKQLMCAFAGAVAVAAVSSAAVPAPRSGPFASLSGSWSGGGTISLNNGSKERIRCRAQYRVTDSGSEAQLELRCAGDSYKFELQSSVSHNGEAISGTWSEATRGAIGTISGTASGNQINLRANSAAFSALLALSTRSNQQSISIQSPGSEISAVAISLNRSR